MLYIYIGYRDADIPHPPDPGLSTFSCGPSAESLRLSDMPSVVTASYFFSSAPPSTDRALGLGCTSLINVLTRSPFSSLSAFSASSFEQPNCDT